MKTSAPMFSVLAQIQFFSLICSLISGITELERALVMVQGSGQSPPVSVSVLICIFIFELQSESSINMLHVFGYFWTVGFGVM